MPLPSSMPPDSQIVEQFVASVLGSPEHHVEVHHIVHDGIVRPVVGFHLSRPTQYRTHDRIEKRSEGISRSENHIFIFLRVIYLISLAVGADIKKSILPIFIVIVYYLIRIK